MTKYADASPKRLGTWFPSHKKEDDEVKTAGSKKSEDLYYISVLLTSVSYYKRPLIPVPCEMVVSNKWTSPSPWS